MNITGIWIGVVILDRDWSRTVIWVDLGGLLVRLDTSSLWLFLQRINQSTKISIYAIRTDYRRIYIVPQLVRYKVHCDSRKKLCFLLKPQLMSDSGETQTSRPPQVVGTPLTPKPPSNRRSLEPHNMNVPATTNISHFADAHVTLKMTPQLV